MTKHFERQERRAALDAAEAAASGYPPSPSCFTPFTPPTLDIQYLSSMTSKEQRAVNQVSIMVIYVYVCVYVCMYETKSNQ